MIITLAEIDTDTESSFCEIVSVDRWRAHILDDSFQYFWLAGNKVCCPSRNRQVAQKFEDLHGKVKKGG